MIGRSVATVAEIAFAVQWALLLREAGATRASRAVVALIVVAEVLSWLAVLTTNNLFHAAENSLWTLTAALALAFLASRWRLVGDRGKRVIAAVMACGAAYIAFMVTVDVPMYLARWQPGQEYLSLGEGMREILQRCIVTLDWAKWREDAPWLTLYFTVAVWISIALPQLPPLKGKSPAPSGRIAAHAGSPCTPRPNSRSPPTRRTARVNRTGASSPAPPGSPWNRTGPPGDSCDRGARTPSPS